MKHIKGEDAEGRHDAVFTFTGKSGKDWDITIEDDHLVDLILKTNRLGAKDADLFMYISKLETRLTSRQSTSINTFGHRAAKDSQRKISERGPLHPVVLSVWRSCRKSDRNKP